MTLRIITVGLGEDMPVADNSTVEGRLLNRRVELTLVPVTS
jgi:outer membrane protein OmpA-like peptidoglycan-associated protein